MENNTIIENTLLLNDGISTIFEELRQSLATCNNFYFNVAFVNYGGLQLFVDTFKQLEEKNIKGKFVTSTYLSFTEPKALRKLQEFSNIDLKVYGDVKKRGFHSKAYIFEYADYFKVIIGSANMTSSALKRNIEWNVRIVSKKNDEFTSKVIKEFLKIWDTLEIVNEDFLNAYEAFIKVMKTASKIGKASIQEKITKVQMNKMQELAIRRLQSLRDNGETKGLIIAATGTGKTYLSAFDVQSCKPHKMLFLVHREEILREAEKSFKNILGSDIESGFYIGQQKDREAKYLFSTINTMNSQDNYQQFDPKEFDYIIIDEAHHVTASMYQKMLAHFEPKFLLGMTATPERSDGEDIFEVFDNNVALEIRLHDALEEDLVVPFHYFGITDIQGIDLTDVKEIDLAEISKRLKVHERVDYIIEKMKHYGHDGEKRKCLAFCVDKTHAKYMCDEFNNKGITSEWLSGDNDSNHRKQIVCNLENKENSLEVIFTVDIFNEGIDIPSVNLVMMLRPTNSPIVFIQQLGRGLRKHEEKEYLTVLDFISNYNRSYLIAIALKGDRSYKKDSLKISVRNDFSNIPGDTYIHMDEIVKERILYQLEIENFNNLTYAKEEYYSFKVMNQGNVLNHLMDYLKYEGAPDPVRFINAVRPRSYINFLVKTEGLAPYVEYISNDSFMKVYRWLSSMLPIRRPHEFAILKALLTNSEVNVDLCSFEICKYLEKVDKSTVIHAMQTINFNYYDKSEIRQKEQIAILKTNTLYATDIMENIKDNDVLQLAILDILNYGLTRYRIEFDEKNYGYPFLKLYELYSKREVAQMTNIKRSFSSCREGIFTKENEYFIFVNLHKDKNIQESIAYEDEFLDQVTFQWESQNETSQSSSIGINIIENKTQNIHLHLFIRKFANENNVAQPYIYFGKVNTKSYERNKPIRFLFTLEHEVPKALYTEMITKVAIPTK